MGNSARQQKLSSLYSGHKPGNACMYEESESCHWEAYKTAGGQHFGLAFKAVTGLTIPEMLPLAQQF